MIEATAVKSSAYFETNLESIKLVKRLSEIQTEIILGGKRYKCVPSVPGIAKRMGVGTTEVARGISELIRLRWVRRYQEGKKTLYAIGTPWQTFMEKEMEKSFAKARRTQTGRIKKTEWRWIPLDQWNGITLWTYLSEHFREMNVWPTYASAKGQAQLQRILGHIGIRQAKQVGDFFVSHWFQLKKKMKWVGTPSPGLFVGYFWTLLDFSKQGIPVCQHDRKHEEDSTGVGAWKEFNGT